MNGESVKLFDYNDNLVPNFDLEIEKILISVHGEDYYDIDEEITNTNYIPVEEVKVEEKKIDKEEIKEEKVEKNKSNSKVSEYVPVIFFIMLFVIIVVAGYYFLNTVDLTSLVS